MAKLTYWYAQRFDDSDCYSIVDKTKRGAQLQREKRLAEGSCDIGPVVKRTIVYQDAFDLFDLATSEGGGRGCSNS